jgi:hypothetical protein
MLEYGIVIGWKEVLRPAPRPFAFDDGVDGDVADPELLHCSFSLPIFLEA